MILDNSYTFVKMLLHVTRFAKTQHTARHNGTFLGNPDFCITEFCIPKALFCSNINAVLQIHFELQG